MYSGTTIFYPSKHFILRARLQCDNSFRRCQAKYFAFERKGKDIINKIFNIVKWHKIKLPYAMWFWNAMKILSHFMSNFHQSLLKIKPSNLISFFLPFGKLDEHFQHNSTVKNTLNFERFLKARQMNFSFLQRINCVIEWKLEMVTLSMKSDCGNNKLLVTRLQRKN